MAYASSETDVSIKLNLAINHGEKLLKGMEKLFSSWEDGEKFLKKILPSLSANPRILFHNVQCEVKKQIGKHPQEFKKLTF